ncbi:MAG: hypothetical protein HWE27_16295 [Gammaproteobacteria bacterium]|nr:hypothetical protein [Gammaproteobacteria bacterium]
MKLAEIIEKLSTVNENLPVKCSLYSIGLTSNVYTVGQVKRDFPGVVLGDREPHLREKVSGEFAIELKTFAERFQENDFLLEQTVDIDEKRYEVRYFKLSDVKVNSEAVLLVSALEELIEFREEYSQVETL